MSTTIPARRMSRVSRLEEEAGADTPPTTPIDGTANNNLLINTSTLNRSSGSPKGNASGVYTRPPKSASSPKSAGTPMSDLSCPVTPRTTTPNAPTNPYHIKRIPCKLAVLGCDDIMNRTSLRSKVDTDPYILIYNAKGEVISKSTAQHNTVHPRFSVRDTTVALALVSTGTITVQVWHKHTNKTVLRRTGEDAFLGEVRISAEDIVDTGKICRLLYSKESTSDGGDQGEIISREEVEDVENMAILELPLEPRTKEPDPAVKAVDGRGQLGRITIAVARIDQADFEEAKKKLHAGSLSPSKTAGGSRYLAGDDLLSTQPTHLVGRSDDPTLPPKLEGREIDGVVTVIGADNVLKRDTEPNSLSDPYAIVYYPNKQYVMFQTETVDCCLRPRWVNTTPIEVYRDDDEAVLIAQLWNANPKPEKDNFLGEARVRASDFPPAVDGVIPEWKVPLHPRRPKESDSAIAKLGGRLGHLVLKWEPKVKGPPLQSHGDLAAPRPATAARCRTPSSALGSAAPTPTTTTARAGKNHTWLDEDDEAMLKRLNIAELNPKLLQSIGATSSAASPSPYNRNAIPQHPSIYFDSEPAEKEDPPYYAPPRREVQGPRYTFYGDTEEACELQREYFHSVAPLQRSEVHPPPSTLPGETDRVAPVELTNIVPVQLVYRGNAIQKPVMVDVDAPTLRPLLKAVEDSFHIHPSSQMLLHSGELLNPLISLRRNGVLLLKGNGAIKVAVKVWRGQRSSFVMQMPNGEVFPVSIDTEWSVQELKQMVVAHIKCPFERPSEMQLIFRYNRLNDRMKLDYYRIPNRSALQVVSRVSSVVERIKAEREAWARGDDGSADDPLSTFKDEDLIGVPRRKTTLELRRDKRLGKGTILPDEWKPMRNGEEAGGSSSGSTLLKSGPSSSGNLLSSDTNTSTAASRNNVNGARGTGGVNNVSRDTATKSFTNARGTVVRDRTTYRDDSGVERVEENTRFEPNPSYSRAGGGARKRPMSGGLGGLPADSGHRPPSAARTRTPTSRGGGGVGGAAPFQPSTFAQRLENSPYNDPQPGRSRPSSSSTRGGPGKQRPLPSTIEGRLDEIHRYEHDQQQRGRGGGGFLPSRATLELASDVGRQHRTFTNLQDQLDYEEDLNAAVWELDDVNMASLERIRELETTLSRFDRIARQTLHMGI